MQRHFRQHAVLFGAILIVAGLFTACSKKMEHEAVIKESLVEMREMAAKLGEPTSVDNILYFGKMKINENFEIVDAIQAKYGCTATFFEKQGDKFVRVSTDVMHDGKRAVGTILDPDGPVIINIRKGKPYYGTVDILGDMYETGYEPIENTAGEIIGIYYTGFQL
ncbi:MAG: Cache 3/Cache 2 fusion domain-containing protein [Candidatus Marinimicrobia bacterium]|nr:Cache 3/Cache 2 fusion domain-containing protein [Candidatus Neomarinimicrobiota bacterium]